MALSVCSAMLEVGSLPASSVRPSHVWPYIPALRSDAIICQEAGTGQRTGGPAARQIGTECGTGADVRLWGPIVWQIGLEAATYWVLGILADRTAAAMTGF